MLRTTSLLSSNSLIHVFIGESHFILVELASLPSAFAKCPLVPRVTVQEVHGLIQPSSPTEAEAVLRSINLKEC